MVSRFSDEFTKKSPPHFAPPEKKVIPFRYAKNKIYNFWKTQNFHIKNKDRLQFFYLLGVLKTFKISKHFQNLRRRFLGVKIVRYDWSFSGGFRLNENVGEIFLAKSSEKGATIFKKRGKF